MYKKLNKCNVYIYELDKMIILIIEKKNILKLVNNLFIDNFVKNIINKSIYESIQIHLM